MCDANTIAQNVPQIRAGPEFPDELPKKISIPKFQFPVNEANKPDLRVFCWCVKVF